MCQFRILHWKLDEWLWLMCEWLKRKLETWIIFLVVPLGNWLPLLCFAFQPLFPHAFLSLLCIIASHVYTSKYRIWSYLKCNSNAIFPTWFFSDSPYQIISFPPLGGNVLCCNFLMACIVFFLGLWFLSVFISFPLPCLEGLCISCIF